MTRTDRFLGLALGVLFIGLHLPFLPPSLEDLDSVNFALGVRDYDVSQHQPHPPGYPVFIAAAKLLHAIGLSEVHALSVLSVFAGGCAVYACVRLFVFFDRDRPPRHSSLFAAVLAVACPLFWFTATRPLSDMTGLAASLWVQVLTLTAASSGALAMAAFTAGLAAGIRSQVVWLTLPLLAFALWRLDVSERRRGAMLSAVAYATGALVWAVPLLVLSGGPAAYLRLFYSQGAEDFTGVSMLATAPSVKQLLRALQAAFLSPWVDWPLGAAVLVFAAVGFVHVALRSRQSFAGLAAAFAPYVAFDLFFQEIATTRYALPVAVPVAYLAARGATTIPHIGVAVVVALIAASTYVSDRATFAFASMPAPAFRMVGDMASAAHPEGASVATTPVLAMHRREYFDFRRPFQWAGASLPAFAQRLPTPPKHEWLEVVKYWNGGGHEPVWFVADPMRADLALIKHDGRPVIYRWPFVSAATLLGGSRPNEMDWHVITSPDWYLGEGWALTPETAGTAREDRKGPGYAPIAGWIRRYPDRVTLMIGGRNLADGGPAARVQVRVDETTVMDETIAPGFFLRMLDLPSTSGPGEYATVTVTADNALLAIEQFDAQPGGRVVYGFGEGWNEQEYNPTTGVLWRWSSDRSSIRVRAEGHALALTLGGEIEAARTSHVTVRAGDKVAAEFDADQTFSRTVLIPAALLTARDTVLTIESSAFYVPAETKWRSNDRRKLGLKLVEVALSPTS